MKLTKIQSLALFLTATTFSTSYGSQNALILTQEERAAQISVTGSPTVTPIVSSPSSLISIEQLETEMAFLESLPSSRVNTLRVNSKRKELEQARLVPMSSAAVTRMSVPHIVSPLVARMVPSTPIVTVSSVSSTMSADEISRKLVEDSLLPSTRLIRQRMERYAQQLREISQTSAPDQEGAPDQERAHSVVQVTPPLTSVPIVTVTNASSTMSADEIRRKLDEDSQLPSTRFLKLRMASYQKQLRDMGQEWIPSSAPVTPPLTSVPSMERYAQQLRCMGQTSTPDQERATDQEGTPSAMHVPQPVPSVQVGPSLETSEYLSDLEFARRLQEEEDGANHAGVFIPVVVMSDEDARAYEQMTNALRIRHDSDVHALTRAAGAHYPTIKRLEQTYLQYTNMLSAQNVLDGRTRFLEDLDGPEFRAFFTLPTQGVSLVQMQIAREFATHEANVRALLETNKGFWNLGAQDVDGETRVSLREVFAHAYQAACYLDNIKGDMEYRGYFCLQLSDNYAYNGGCHPGITGRLIELYRQILAIGLGG